MDVKSKRVKKPKEGLNIIRLPELCKKIGMSKPSVYRMTKQGHFSNSILCCRYRPHTLVKYEDVIVLFAKKGEGQNHHL
jgi:hypothetical protein